MPKIGLWLLWAGLAAFIIWHTVSGFIQLHNGASIEDVDGRRYLPVVSEVILMTMASVFLILGLKYLTKLSIVALVMVSVCLLALTLWFGYWAFIFTGQDPVGGFITIAIIIGSVSIITIVALLVEGYRRNHSKKR